MKTVPASRRGAVAGMTVFGILLIAANLRAPITSLAPILTLIRDGFHLTTAQAGALTTLPLLAFAVVSPFAASLSRRFGIERALFAALLVMAAGIALRSLDAAWCLYAGTVIVGAGIAVGNVLLPSLLKRDFPERVTALTGAYALTMGMAAALGSAIMVPLVHLTGGRWRLSLAMFILLPLLAAASWLPRLGPAVANVSAPAASVPHGANMLRSGLAWQVTLFLGLNSFIYYIVIGWLPAVLTDSGFSAAQAGALDGAMQFSTAVPGLLLAPLIARIRDQRGVGAAVSLMSALGMLGLVLWPSGALIWVLLFGIGTGAAMILGLALISMRVTGSRQAAALSGMAQCIGYLLAALGPALIGALRDATGGWDWPLLICTVSALLMAVFGFMAGRDRQIGL
ncbi:MFS transporter [Martelella alba]|uniref:CynX/NimT family MFS transporter n=1 Tax=Martelella alba TaxID=2590451 RepID=A0ABY2SH13_9HYPH|nr:MFS transporter [Martelella alba]TKI04487.1 CynX/NimT family MFS transporter [Martelella alba]